jgi:hypothetical protein
VMHGCKYSRDDCPVEIGAKLQSFPCEQCQFEMEEEFYTWLSTPDS